MILPLNQIFIKHIEKIRIFKFSLKLFIILVVLIPNSGYSQTVIKGTVYAYNKNEPVFGYWVVRTDSLMTDSIAPKNLDGVLSKSLAFGAELNGNFTIINSTKKNTDILINLFGYRNTIIKNIPNNNDTIQLSYIPLFIDDEVIHVTLVLSRWQKFFSIFRKKYWHNQSIIGTEGPFSYKDELMISCIDDPKKKINCKKTKYGIEIDYKEILTCGNK